MAIEFRWQLLQEACKNFFQNGTEDPAAFPPEVYASWKRSLAYGLHPDRQISKMLTPEELVECKQENKLLLDVVTPFMDFLYELVKGSGFVIIFSDRDGYILRIIGDEDTLADIQIKENPLVEGVCRNESVFGTGGIGTPLAIRKPVQLSSYEMFYPSRHEFTGAGAPLIDADGNLQAVICMFGTWNRSHSHTLGMVAATSCAIMRQFSLQGLYDRLAIAENQMQSIISTINLGFPLLDRHHRIVRTNDMALKALNYVKDEVLGRSISNIISSFIFIRLRKNVFDREMHIQGKYNVTTAFVTVQRVQASAQPNNGSEMLLITFRQSIAMRKFVTQYIGANAMFHFEDIVGGSVALSTTKSFARVASSNSANVLLLGESGTGKELFAQSIHNSSQFSSGPFIAVNCGAIPKSLVESELFGYESGSFTGAKREGSAGKFELANNGTIFLDEIGDMPYEVQVHLLRILQTKEVIRIGGKKPILGLAPEVHQAFLSYPWPGNVRELENSIECACLLTSDDYILPMHIAANILHFHPAETAASKAALPAKEPAALVPSTISSLEKELILQHLAICHGNVKQTAVSLGISRRTLYRKMEKNEIDYQNLRFR